MYAWGLPSFKKIVTDYYVKPEVGLFSQPLNR